MKPHEETWAALRNTVRCGKSEQVAVFSSDLPGATAIGLDTARAKLAAQAPAMARLLLENVLEGPRLELRANEDGRWADFESQVRKELRAAGVIP